MTEDETKKIFFYEKGKKIELLLLRKNKKFFAYKNECKHISIPLDWGDSNFLTDDKKFIVCRNHGALYLPETGECIEGPCFGTHLEKIDITKRKIYLK